MYNINVIIYILNSYQYFYSHYRNTILNGAAENNLPTNYIKVLKTIPHNGYEGEYDIR